MGVGDVTHFSHITNLFGVNFPNVVLVVFFLILTLNVNTSLVKSQQMDEVSME